MSTAVLRAPFPYFGGKRRAASLVWGALGNVDHYVEPFAGSAAVLLARPHVGRCETINDADGMVSNFWRAVRSQPDVVARHADWPVLEIDLHARHAWLIGQRESLTERLLTDADWFDAKVAGWWVWGICAWIGDGWCDKARRGLPDIGNEGRGLLAPMRGGALADDAVSFRTPAEWLRALSARLVRVRSACGDWKRVTGPSVLLPPSMPSDALCGIYFDPPYSEGSQQYVAGGTGTNLAASVRDWCAAHDTDPRLRMVLSGYDGDHNSLQDRGWRVVSWKTKGGLSRGKNSNQHRERLWLSPHCLGDESLPLFGGGAR